MHIIIGSLWWDPHARYSYPHVTEVISSWCIEKGTRFCPGFNIRWKTTMLCVVKISAMHRGCIHVLGCIIQWFLSPYRCRIELVNFAMGFNIIAPYMEMLHINISLHHWIINYNTWVYQRLDRIPQCSYLACFCCCSSSSPPPPSVLLHLASKLRPQTVVWWSKLIMPDIFQILDEDLNFYKRILQVTRYL